MRDYRTNYVVVGTFVLVVTLGLVVALAVLAGRTGAADSYYACFDDVTGVSFGTQVLYQGYAVGQVEGIEPREGIEEGPSCPEGRRFRVRLSIRQGWPVDAEARARITQAGFLSAMVVDIQGGDAEATLEPGSRIAGVEQPDMLTAISGLSGQVSALLDDVVRPLMEELGEQVPRLVSEARRVTEQMDATAGRLNELLAPANLDRASRMLANAEDASQELATMARELRDTRQRMDAAVTTFSRLVEENEGEVDRAVADLGYTLDTVARRIDAFTRNLESASRNLSELTRRVRAQPSLLLRSEAPPETPGGGEE